MNSSNQLSMATCTTASIYSNYLLNSLDRFAFLGWYVDLVLVPDGDKLEEEVSLEFSEESERAEEDGELSSPLMNLEGVRIVCPYPRLNLDPL